MRSNVAVGNGPIPAPATCWQPAPPVATWTFGPRLSWYPYASWSPGQFVVKSPNMAFDSVAVLPAGMMIPVANLPPCAAKLTHAPVFRNVVPSTPTSERYPPWLQACAAWELPGALPVAFPWLFAAPFPWLLPGPFPRPLPAPADA